MEECKSAFNILKSKPKGKGSLGRFRNRWKDYIRIDLKSDRCQYEELFKFSSGQRLLENPYESDIEPLGSISQIISYIPFKL